MIDFSSANARSRPSLLSRAESKGLGANEPFPIRSFDSLDGPEPVAHGDMLIKTPANLCLALKLMLAERFGLEVRQHVAQDLTAQFFGAESWQHLTSKSGLDLCRLSPVAIHIQEGPSELDQAHRFYRSPAAGAWGFGQHLLSRSYPYPPSYRGRCFMASCPHLFVPANDEDDIDSEIGLYAPNVVDYEEATHLDTAAALLASGDDLAGILSAYFRIGSPEQLQIAASNRRMKISERNELVIGDWLLTIRQHGEEDTGRYLFVESLANMGKRGIVANAAIYSLMPPIAPIL